MDITINSLSEVLQEAEIVLSEEELQPHFNAAYGKEQKRLEIKGFRKGKAPLSIIKKLYGEAIEHQALDSAANDFYRKAMDERSIRPIGQPSLVDMDYRRGERFRFRIQYEIRPAITVDGYRGLSVEKPVHSVNDEEVEAEILRLQKSNSTSEEASAVTDNEYVVTVDIQELDPLGTPLIGKKARDVQFYLADEKLSTEIRDALKRAETGGTYRARLEPDRNGERQAMDVSLTVSKIEKVVIPPLDETLVSKISGGRTGSVDEFRAKMKSDLEAYWNDWSDHKLSDAISAEIVKSHDFPVPESLIDSLMDSYIEDIRSNSRNRTLPDGFDEEKFRHDSRGLAVWQAKWMLLKEQIAEKEGISVTDEDILETSKREAEKTGLPEAKVLDYYRRSATGPDRILSRKIMDFLISHAHVTEKPAEAETDTHLLKG